MTPLTVDFQLDPDTKRWTATMPEVPALVTQGKTLKEAHERVRAALALFRDDAAEVILKGRTLWQSDLRISPAALRSVRTEADLRVAALDVDAQLAAATVEAVKVLVVQERQTYRAAGQLLGITHQRVEQIAKAVASEQQT